MFRGALRAVVQRVGADGCTTSRDAFGATQRWYAKSTRRTPGQTRPSAHDTSPAVVRWTEVRDPTTGGSYWWNKATNQTTAIGAPKPKGGFVTDHGPSVNALSTPYDGAGRPTVGLAIGQMFVFGFGGALGVTFVSAAVAAIAGGAKMERRHAELLEGETSDTAARA